MAALVPVIAGGLLRGTTVLHRLAIPGRTGFPDVTDVDGFAAGGVSLWMTLDPGLDACAHAVARFKVPSATGCACLLASAFDGNIFIPTLDKTWADVAFAGSARIPVVAHVTLRPAPRVTVAAYTTALVAMLTSSIPCNFSAAAGGGADDDADWDADAAAGVAADDARASSPLALFAPSPPACTPRRATSGSLTPLPAVTPWPTAAARGASVVATAAAAAAELGDAQRSAFIRVDSARRVLAVT